MSGRTKHRKNPRLERLPSPCSFVTLCGPGLFSSRSLFPSSSSTSAWTGCQFHGVLSVKQSGARYVFKGMSFQKFMFMSSPVQVVLSVLSSLNHRFSPEHRREIVKAVNKRISIYHYIAGIQPPDPVDVLLSSDKNPP